MNGAPHDLVLFLGRFHVLLVHLPIGGLILLAILELVAKSPRFKHAAQGNQLILGLLAGSSIAAALLGLMLSQSGGYDAQFLTWHKWTGFAVAAICSVAWVLSWLGWPRASFLCVLATLAVLAVASHLGASLTHGRDYLGRYAPGPLRSLLGSRTDPTPVATTNSERLSGRLFLEVIQPILTQRCSSCHGPEKQKGELRVDSLEALQKGGQSGPAFVAGNPGASLMIKRILLPPDQEEHMPPEGKPQPTPAEITTLQWWVECGARP
jgi:hypothetical protein